MEWSGRTEYVSVVIVGISYTFFSSFQLKTRLSIWQEKRKKYPFHCYFDTQHKCTNVRLNNYRDSFSPYYAIFVFFAIINFVVNKHRSVFLSVRQITIFYSCHLDKRFFQFEVCLIQVTDLCYENVFSASYEIRLSTCDVWHLFQINLLKLGDRNSVVTCVASLSLFFIIFFRGV